MTRHTISTLAAFATCLVGTPAVAQPTVSLGPIRSVGDFSALVATNEGPVERKLPNRLGGRFRHAEPKEVALEIEADRCVVVGAWSRDAHGTVRVTVQPSNTNTAFTQVAYTTVCAERQPQSKTIRIEAGPGTRSFQGAVLLLRELASARGAHGGLTLGTNLTPPVPPAPPEPAVPATPPTPAYPIGGGPGFVGDHLRALYATHGNGALPMIAVANTTLGAGERREITFPVHAGVCYVILAAGMPSVRELDLSVLDPYGNERARDTTHDAFPFVRVCPEVDGEYRILVGMYLGYGPYGLQVFRQ